MRPELAGRRRFVAHCDGRSSGLLCYSAKDPESLTPQQRPQEPDELPARFLGEVVGLGAHSTGSSKLRGALVKVSERL